MVLPVRVLTKLFANDTSCQFFSFFPLICPSLHCLKLVLDPGWKWGRVGGVVTSALRRREKDVSDDEYEENGMVFRVYLEDLLVAIFVEGC